MALGIGDNFNYKGKKSNFERDSFTNKAAMKAFSENDLDEGHISYCKEDGKHYVFRSTNPVDAVTGRWRELTTSSGSGGGGGGFTIQDGIMIMSANSKVDNGVLIL